MDQWHQTDLLVLLAPMDRWIHNQMGQLVQLTPMDQYCLQGRERQKGRRVRKDQLDQMDQ